MPFESSLPQDAEELAQSCMDRGDVLVGRMIRTLTEAVRDRDRKLLAAQRELRRWKAPRRKSKSTI